MARITVEDCIERVPNMFQLVLIAAKRARQLANGAEPMVDWENDKPTVVALREVAEGYITESILEEREHNGIGNIGNTIFELELSLDGNPLDPWLRVRPKRPLFPGCDITAA